MTNWIGWRKGTNAKEEPDPFPRMPKSNCQCLQYNSNMPVKWLNRPRDDLLFAPKFLENYLKTVMILALNGTPIVAVTFGFFVWRRSFFIIIIIIIMMIRFAESSTMWQTKVQSNKFYGCILFKRLHRHYFHTLRSNFRDQMKHSSYCARGLITGFD